MALNERKIKILNAIISDYIQTAEPIGSRTIAKKYDFGISSATIRNEMSDLEDMGLIIQPHSSSGRIPSDKGYRLYVDKLMIKKELTHDEILFLQEIVSNNINQIDYLMQETAKAISLLTNYTAIVKEPRTKDIKIKHLQLISLDDTSLLLITVIDIRIVKNNIIKTNKSYDTTELFNLSNILNVSLSGLTLNEITESTAIKLNDDFKEDHYLVSHILWAVKDALFSEDKSQVYLSGAKNILEFPEFSDIAKAKVIFKTLEEKDILVTLLSHNIDDKIQIMIGSENDIVEMKDCSVIKAKYNMGDDSYGTIGIIGPTRMDYPQVVSVLNNLVRNIDMMIKAFTGG